MRISAVLAAVGLLALATTSQARTWRVEKDGSGDFAVIQDAIDAAASGDTIGIGPGRFEENRFAYNNGFENINSCGHVTHDELTFVGVGDQTIIGFDQYNPNMNPRIFGFSCVHNSTKLNIDAVALRGLYTGVHFEGAVLRVGNLALTSNGVGIFAVGNQGNEIYGCRFTELIDLGVLGYAGSASVVVDDCDFSDSGWGATAIDMVNSSEVVIDGCSILGCTKGIQLEQGSSGTIENCSVDCLGTALKVSTGSHCATTNCLYVTNSSSLQYALYYDGTGSIRADGCRIQGGELTAHIQAINVDIHNCELLNGGGQTIQAWMSASGLDQPIVLDLSNNYWGTTDTAQIASWITDYRDFPPLEGQHWVIVDYEPLGDLGQATEPVSWGAVKSLFAQ
jgi:parallel beta-helix repeat protein